MTNKQQAKEAHIMDSYGVDQKTAQYIAELEDKVEELEALDRLKQQALDTVPAGCLVAVMGDAQTVEEGLSKPAPVSVPEGWAVERHDKKTIIVDGPDGEGMMFRSDEKAGRSLNAYYFFESMLNAAPPAPAVDDQGLNALEQVVAEIQETSDYESGEFGDSPAIALDWAAGRMRDCIDRLRAQQQGGE